MARIFISYKRVDLQKVKKIKEQIDSALNEKCWIDMDGIESDAQFKDVIIKAINECEIMLFMYSSSHSKIIDYEKDWTIRELNFASLKHKRIVFINLDNSKLTDQLEFDFSSKQQIDGTSQASLEHLIKDLRHWLGYDVINEEKSSELPAKCITTHEMPTDKANSKAETITVARNPKHKGRIFKPILFATIAIAVGVSIYLSQDRLRNDHDAVSEDMAEIDTTDTSGSYVAEPECPRFENRACIVAGHEYSDLGLSVLWSTCNLGAEYPEDAGSYFAWGEISVKSRYDWRNLRYHSETASGNGHTFSKYITSQQFGRIDNRRILDSGDDAASTAWGNGWRMPSRQELNELRTSCDWTWTSRNDKSGFEVTSRTNGASIFIPATGYKEGADIIGWNSDGYLWSSELFEGGRNAYYLYFKKGETDISNMGRYLGLCIRPVFPLLSE